MNTDDHQETKTRKPRSVVLREDLLAITDNPIKTVILGQMMYWATKIKDTTAFLLEEKLRGGNFETTLEKGWFYKSAIQLQDELLGLASEKTIRICLSELVNSGYIHARSNPHHQWDKTLQYRVDLVAIENAIELHWTPISKTKIELPKRIRKEPSKPCGKNDHTDPVNLPDGENSNETEIDDRLSPVNLPPQSSKFTGALPKIKTENNTKNTINTSISLSDDNGVGFQGDPLPFSDLNKESKVAEQGRVYPTDSKYHKPPYQQTLPIEEINIGKEPPVANHPLKPSAPPKPAKPKRAASLPDYRPDDFEKVWIAYHKIGNRIEAVKEWDKLQPTQEEIDAMLYDLSWRWANDFCYRDEGKIKHFCRWLKAQSWNDVRHERKEGQTKQTTGQNYKVDQKKASQDAIRNFINRSDD